jgi:hypothetical protein
MIIKKKQLTTSSIGESKALLTLTACSVESKAACAVANAALFTVFSIPIPSTLAHVATESVNTGTTMHARRNTNTFIDIVFTHSTRKFTSALTLKSTKCVYAAGTILAHSRADC